MAILQMPVNNSNPFADVIGDDLAPAGTFTAMVIDIKDEFGVQRQKFQSLEMEVVDLTCFLFGFRDAQGFEHRVSSRRMKISGNPKSTLFTFLKCLQGCAPEYGRDYMALKGAQCLLTVEHIQKRDGAGVFAAIAALSPVPAGFGQLAPTAPAPRPAAVAPVTAGPASPPYPVRPVAAPVTVRPGMPVAGVRSVVAGAPSVAPVAVVPANDPLPF